MILFKSEKALSFLTEHGFVYTLRARKRKTGRSVVGQQKGKPLFPVYIYFVKEIPLDEALEPYVPYSGFDSVSEWLSEFRRLNRSSNSTAFLYKVVRVRE